MSGKGCRVARGRGWLCAAAAASVALVGAVMDPMGASAATGTTAVDAAELARAVEELANPGSSLSTGEAAVLHGEYVRRLTAIDDAVSRCDSFLDRHGGNQAVQQILRRERRKKPGELFFTRTEVKNDLEQAVGGAVDLSQQDLELCLRMLDQGAGGHGVEPAALAAIGTSVKKCLSSLSSVGPNAAGVAVLERAFRRLADDTFTSARTLAALERAVGDLPLRPRELETCVDAFDQHAALEQITRVGVNLAPCASGETQCGDARSGPFCCPSGQTCGQFCGGPSHQDCSAICVSSSPPCFPADATVTTDAGVVKAMTDVRLGDRVLVARPDATLGYEEVYLNTHKDGTWSGPYVVLTLASGRALTLSPRHFIPVAGGEGGTWDQHLTKGADEVRADDLVWSRGEDGRMALDRVVRAETRVAVGAYNPLTMNGTIVVDGVVASAHSDWFLDGLVSANAQAKIYQAILAPVRLGYRLLGPDWMATLTEDAGIVDTVRRSTGPGTGLAWVLLGLALALGTVGLVMRRRASAG